MNGNVYGKLVPVFALVLLLVALPGYAATECEDSPEVIVMPDCTTVEVTTCYCEINPAGDTLEITVAVGEDADEGTPDLNGDLCVPDETNLAADVEVDDVVPRRGMKNGNSTPAPKGSTDITCTDCPGVTVSVDVGASAKKNAHFDIILSNGEEMIGVVGFNTHTQACEVPIS